MKIQYANWVKIRKIALFTLLVTLSVLYQKSMGQNVGITNTTSITPYSLLHIHDNNATGQLFQLTNTTSGTGASTNGFGVNLNTNFKVEFKNQYNNAAAGISFYTNNGTVTEKMTISNNGNVGIGTTPNASAILDMHSVTNKGILVPQVALTATSDATTIASPTTSLMIYNTATAGTFPTNVTPGYYFWNGTQWQRFSTNPRDAWYTAGNTGTNYVNDFLGTTDNQPLTIRSNNVERMRITPVGEVIVGGTAPVLPGDLFIATSLPSYPWPVNGYAFNDGGGVYGAVQTTSTTNFSAIEGAYEGSGLGSGVYGNFFGTNAAGGKGVSGYAYTSSATGSVYGVNGYAESDASGSESIGVNGLSMTDYSGWAVYGLKSNWLGTIQTTGFLANSTIGAYGESTIAAGYGVYGKNTGATGIGIIGAGNNVVPYTIASGAGGAFTGTRYGLFAANDDETTAGTGYSLGQTYSSVYSENVSSVAANAAIYHFGMHGAYYDNGTSYGYNSGGVLGTLVSTNTTYGILGFENATTVLGSGVVSYNGMYGYAPAVANCYSLQLNGDFYNQQTASAGTAVAIAAATVAQTAAAVTYRTGSSIMIYAYYSGETGAATARDINIRIERNVNGGAVWTPIAYASASTAAVAGYGGCATIVWRETGLVDGNTYSYRLLYTVSAALNNVNSSIVVNVIKD